MKRSPLKPKRERPRRKAGRIAHQRMKPKASAPPTAEERIHLAYVASLPCLICGKQPVTVHHVTATIHGGRTSRSHKRVAPLCVEHHQHDHGPLSVERLGHKGFWLAHGIDLLAEAERLWLVSESKRDRASYPEEETCSNPAPRGR